MKTRRIDLAITALCFLLVLISASLPVSAAASQTTFQSASSAISVAYAQIYNIEHNGGNATTFAIKLNVAISLYNKALGENMTNPSQALTDLQNATQLANSVRSQAAPMAQKLETQRAQQNFLEIGSSLAVVIAAVLCYFYGSRIYDWVWIYQRRDYLIEGNKKDG